MMKHILQENLLEKPRHIEDTLHKDEMVFVKVGSNYIAFTLRFLQDPEIPEELRSKLTPAFETIMKPISEDMFERLESEGFSHNTSNENNTGDEKGIVFPGLNSMTLRRKGGFSDFNWVPFMDMGDGTGFSYTINGQVVEVRIKANKDQTYSYNIVISPVSATQAA